MLKSEKFTAEAGMKMVHANLEQAGFAPRDADPSDFARGDDRSLRFKTGCAYAEVTVLPMIDNKQQPAIRATSWAGLDRLLIQMLGTIDRQSRMPEERR